MEKVFDSMGMYTVLDHSPVVYLKNILLFVGFVIVAVSIFPSTPVSLGTCVTANNCSTHAFVLSNASIT